MPEEQKLTEINGDAHLPATKGDVNELAALVANTMASKEELKNLVTKEEFNQRFEQVDQRFDQIQKLITDQAEETRRAFVVAIEDSEDQTRGANEAEISLINDQKIPDLDDRVQTIEKHTGLPVGPRHAAT